MITCCELALYIALGAFVVILALLAMFFNYTLKLKDRQIILEKKNGHEQHQIDELKKEVEQLKNKSRGVKN
jgi:cell division protein FtsL